MEKIMSKTNSEGRNVREAQARILRDDELDEVTGGVYVGPAQSAILIGLLLPDGPGGPMPGGPVLVHEPVHGK